MVLHTGSEAILSKQISRHPRMFSNVAFRWSFQTQRYFGHEHEKIKATRLVTLRPQGILPEDFEEFETESDSE